MLDSNRANNCSVPCLLSPPRLGSPQVTPSSCRTAKTPCTPVSCSCTWLQSPYSVPQTAAVPLSSAILGSESKLGPQGTPRFSPGLQLPEHQPAASVPALRLGSSKCGQRPRLRMASLAIRLRECRFYCLLHFESLVKCKRSPKSRQVAALCCPHSSSSRGALFSARRTLQAPPSQMGKPTALAVPRPCQAGA